MSKSIYSISRELVKKNFSLHLYIVLINFVLVYASVFTNGMLLGPVNRLIMTGTFKDLLHATMLFINAVFNRW